MVPDGYKSFEIRAWVWFVREVSGKRRLQTRESIRCRGTCVGLNVHVTGLHDRFPVGQVRCSARANLHAARPLIGFLLVFDGIVLSNLTAVHLLCLFAAEEGVNHVVTSCSLHFLLYKGHSVAETRLTFEYTRHMQYKWI